MANMVDYVEWRGDLSFKISPMNEVDAVVFMFTSFNDYSAVPSDIKDGFVDFSDAVRAVYGDNFEKKPLYGGAIMPNKDNQRLLSAMLRSKRFGHVKIAAFVDNVSEKSEQQFSAFTVKLDDGTIYVNFVGTDDTIVGWKEDLNMSFSDEVPCQRRAVEYLDRIADKMHGKIVVGGHSKGGNLAVFAAAKCKKSTQKKIIRVISADGPGFKKEFYNSEGYAAIRPKVKKLVPQESIVGMFFANDGDGYEVVKSGSSGVLQHNSHFWEVKGTSFVRMAGLTPRAAELSRVINEWIEDKDYETRKDLSQCIYEMMTAENAKTLTDFDKDKTLFWRSAWKLEPTKREKIFKSVMEIMGGILKMDVKSLSAKREKPKKTESAPKLPAQKESAEKSSVKNEKPPKPAAKSGKTTVKK